MCWTQLLLLSPGLLLVTTPFTMARLLSCCCFLFARLYHLVLDEADRLFTLAPEQVMAGAGPICCLCCWGLSSLFSKLCKKIFLSLFGTLLQPVVRFSSVLTKQLLLLPDGDYPAALPEGDLQPGKEPLPSAACRCGKAVEQSHGSAGCDSHAVPLHRSWHSRGKRALWECAAGKSWQEIKKVTCFSLRALAIDKMGCLGWTNRSVFSLQVVLLTVETNKLSMLLGTLDLKPDVGQKTLIITSSTQEVELLFQVT